MTLTNNMRKKNGVALWRQIADRIRTAIAAGEYDGTGMLPSEMVLAERFGVNRHTVRGAIAALADEGIVQALQGRGTLITRKDRLNFPISKRTRFTTGLGDQAREMEGLLLAHSLEGATTALAEKLNVAPGAPLIRLELLRKVDHKPVSRSTSWFPAERFGGIATDYEDTGSITEALKRSGVEDYVRASTIVSARHAEADDLADLELSPGAILLVSDSLNVDMDGQPIQFGTSRFPADVVQFTVEN